MLNPQHLPDDYLGEYLLASDKYVIQNFSSNIITKIVAFQRLETAFPFSIY